MRQLLRFSILPTAASALVLAACSDSPTRGNRAMNDDLKRDLQAASSSGLNLASTQRGVHYGPTEEAPPQSAPQHTKTLRKAPNSDKSVISKNPTVKAAPAPIIAVAQTPDIQVTANKPEPQPDPSAPAVPRPAPVPIGVLGTGTDMSGGGGMYPGGGGGVIIRGGGIGDDDHCEIIPAGRRPRGIYPGRTPFPGQGRMPPGGSIMRPRF